VASELLEEAGRQATAKGLGSIALDTAATNEAAQALYEKAGFRVTERMPPKGRIPGIVGHGIQADAAELMQVVVDEISDATENLEEKEINRAKAQMKAGLLMALESSGARAEQLARQMLAYDRPLTLEEIVTKVDAVTVESARAAGRALLARSAPAIAALGPGHGLASAAAIAESLARRAA
jgi:hypothetical protein